MSEQNERPVILIVDDEPLITDLLRTALEEAGYSSVEAPGVDEALALLDKDGARFAGLVTDINLGSPKRGWDVARDARILVDAGFTLERVLPVDQFLWSPHVELVGVFGR